MVLIDNEVDKAAWECGLLTAFQDEIKAGNISVDRSKRFGRFDSFFVSNEKWIEKRRIFSEEQDCLKDT